MRKLALSFLLASLACVGALAQPVTNPSSVGVAGAYNSSPPTCTDGQFCFLQADVHGNLQFVPASNPTTSMQVVGNAAGSSADSGNPVKVGAIYNSTLPTYTNGQRSDLQVGTRGSVNVTLFAPDSTTSASVAGITADGVGSSNSLATATYNRSFNGSSWDRTFTCTNTATVSVTAGNTTEIVALTASQVIRVCSFAVSMSAAGTAKFVYGTGTNCGTGTTDITAAMNLATGTPLAMSAGNNSLFRTASANALCVTAATGNVVGFVSYAKY